jgi:UDP-glucuronate 4-epimerase
VQLERYIDVIEEYLGKRVERNLLPLQQGDVPDTYADVADLVRDFDYRPSTTVEQGVQRFIDWYLEFFGADAPPGSPAAGQRGARI